MSILAIVGCGPRGLASLEYLLEELQEVEVADLKIIIFDPAVNLGAGTVWKTDQSDANWMNSSLRALNDLEGRPNIKIFSTLLPLFPKFNDWLDMQHTNVRDRKKDVYLMRSLMGKYLSERFESIAQPLVLNGKLQIIRKEIIYIDITINSVILTDKNHNEYELDHCLLTVGHQRTLPDKQMQDWINNTKRKNMTLIQDPYQENINEKVSEDDIVGIRGLGLSAIDIIRTLTLGRGGSFKSENGNFLKFIDSKLTPNKIIPYSLDGLIAAPKPLNEAIDRIFKPSENELRDFKKSLSSALDDSNSIESNSFLIEIFSQSFAVKFSTFYKLKTPLLREITRKWLESSSTEHPLFLDTNMDRKLYLKELAKMASGDIPPTIDYAIGQLWRWFQPTMYKLISHSALPDEIMTEVIKLDESTKRYSYGPPVESTLQLIALAEHGILDLSLANDPEISIVSNEWYLKKNGKHEKCSVMIDSVLSSPNIKNIAGGPLKALIDNDKIQLVNDQLGISTNPDGTIQSAADPENRISILGRNIKGSVLGVDAILECFGPRVRDWAKGITQRLIEG